MRNVKAEMVQGDAWKDLPPRAVRRNAARAFGVLTSWSTYAAPRYVTPNGNHIVVWPVSGD